MQAFKVNNAVYCFYRAGYFEGYKIKNKFNKYYAGNTVFRAPHGYLILTNIYQQLAGCITEVQLLPNENKRRR